jgi:hypothetical protein
MILDYSHPGARRPWLACWLRSLWSHRARVEVALGGSSANALLLLAVIAVLAAALSTTHAHLHAILAHARVAGISGRLLPLLRDDFASAVRSIGRFTLLLAPIYFAALTLLLGAAAKCWARRSPSGGRSCAGCFALLAAGSMPLLWFFILLQLEAVAPFLSDRSMWDTSWNPISNLIRFFFMLLAIGLLGLWIVDLSRLVASLRQLRGTGNAHLSGHREQADGLVARDARPEPATTTAPDRRYTRPA